MTGDGASAADTATLLRRGICALAALGIAGTVVELVFLRHWQSATQLIVWPALVVLAVALLALVRRPTARTVRVVRSLAATVGAVALIGIALHVIENLAAGPLDREFAATWDSMSAVDQWWAAITGGVGPAPVLAPGVLAEISLALAVATLRHPSLGDRPADLSRLAIERAPRD